MSPEYVPRKELDLHFEHIEQAIERLATQHTEDMKVLRNGAQASLNTSYQLNGDVQFGVPGFIPTVNAELANLRNEQQRLRAEVEARDKKDDARFERIEYRGQIIQRASERIIKITGPIMKVVDWKIWLLAALLAIIKYVPWIPVQHFLTWVISTIHPKG